MWYLFYLFIRFIAWLVQTMPVQWGYRLADIVFGTSYHLWKEKQIHTQENVSRIMGKHPSDPAVHRLALQAWRNFGRYFIEFLRMPMLTESSMKLIHSIENENNLQEALAHLKGAIVVQAHFGNMDMGGACLFKYNRTVSVAADILKPKQLMDWTIRTRAKWRMELVPNKGSLPVLQAALEKGGLVGLVVDTGVRKNGIQVNFFGEASLFPAGPALLAQRTGAVVVPSCTYRTETGKFVTVVDKPFLHKDTGNESRDLQVTTQRLIDGLEKYIAEHPDQWYIFRPIWQSEKSSSMMGI